MVCDVDRILSFVRFWEQSVASRPILASLVVFFRTLVKMHNMYLHIVYLRLPKNMKAEVTLQQITGKQSHYKKLNASRIALDSSEHICFRSTVCFSFFFLIAQFIHSLTCECHTRYRPLPDAVVDFCSLLSHHSNSVNITMHRRERSIDKYKFVERTSMLDTVVRTCQTSFSLCALHDSISHSTHDKHFCFYVMTCNTHPRTHAHRTTHHTEPKHIGKVRISWIFQLGNNGNDIFLFNSTHQFLAAGRYAPTTS